MRALVQKHWHNIVLISLIGICSIAIAHLLLHLSHEQMIILELFDIVFLFILAVDVYYRFKASHDRIKFLRKNWIEIIVLLPIGAFSELFRLGELLRFGELIEFVRVFKFAQLSVHARELASFLPLSFFSITLSPKVNKNINKKKKKSHYSKTNIQKVKSLARQSKNRKRKGTARDLPQLKSSHIKRTNISTYASWPFLNFNP
ncbi:MAG: hypothetical protein QXW70_04340 [Candidatus Anstonellales archaeon]